MTKPAPKIAILHQGCVPVYRAPFYEALNKESTRTYEVIHGPAPTGTSLMVADGPFSFANRYVTHKELRPMGRTLIYQPVVWDFIRGRYDAAVLGHEFKYLSHYLILAACKLKGRPVIWWGFGRHVYTGDAGGNRLVRLAAKVVAGLKSWTAKVADGYLAYTESGRAALIETGLKPERVAVLRNTIDVDAQIALHRATANEDKGAIRQALGLKPDSAVYLYVGRIVPDKHVDALVRYAKARAETTPGGPPVEIVIVGDGPGRADLEQDAQGLDAVHFTGSVDPLDPRLAQLMRVSTALVIPGYVGLAVNHAFAHGLPVVTRASEFHSPEIEYMEHEGNGLIVPGEEADFFAALDRLAADPETQARLSDGALASRESLTLDHMVRAFDGLVADILSAKRGGRAQESHAPGTRVR